MLWITTDAADAPGRFGHRSHSILYLIHGVVRDPEGLPVPQARAFFLSGPGQFPDIAALTDEQGEFTLSAPSPGTYRIECVAEGFTPEVTPVHLQQAEEAHVEILLSPSS